MAQKKYVKQIHFLCSPIHRFGARLALAPPLGQTPNQRVFNSPAVSTKAHTMIQLFWWLSLVFEAPPLATI